VPLFCQACSTYIAASIMMKIAVVGATGPTDAGNGLAQLGYEVNANL
jgi:hypothetical protein